MSTKINTQLFSIEAFLPSLPKWITDNYSVHSVISINHHNAIFTLEEKVSNQTCILKILDREYYHRSLYQKIFSLTDSYLLLPKHFISDSVSICSLYPKMLPLPEVLYTKGMNYYMIHNLISDLGKAVSTLHNHQIIHLDITPDNIFMDKDGHFYLGDFSSSQFAKKASFLPFYHYSRTGSTPSFAPPLTEHKEISYWNDCYSFALILYMVCNYGNLPGNKESSFSPFDSLLSFLEKALQNPDSIHKNLISEWLEKIESLLTICGNDSACKGYHFQIDSNTLNFLSASTLENIPANSQRLRCKQRGIKRTFSVPAPFYGLLLLCGLILAFSIYRYTSRSKDRNISYISSNYITHTDNSSPPTASPAATKTPIPSPLPTLASSPPPTKKALDSILNLSKIQCQNRSFQIKLSHNPFVKILFANHCDIIDITLFSNLKNLEELYLFDNKITILKGLKKLPELKVLVLSKNKITNLTPLADLTSLTTLDLSHNHHLTHINSLTAITNLQTLILTNTNITQEEITYLQKKLPNCIIYY